MSIEITNVQRLRVYTEPNGSFAVDGSGTLGNFTDVPFIEGTASATLGYEMLDPMHAQQHIDGITTRVPGTKSVSLSFEINLAPTGTAAASGVTAVQSALGELLAAVMGGEVLSTGDDVQAGSPTATTFDVADASTNNIARGGYVGLLNSSGFLEARPLKNVATNACTLRLALSGAPSTNDDVYGAALYYMTQDPNTSLQFVLEGYESQDRWLLRGLQLESMALSLPLGELPRLTLNFQGAVWDYGDDAATDLTASALAAATYSNVSVIHTVGNFYYQTASTSTLPTALSVSDVSMEPSISYAPVTSPSADASGEHVVTRYRRVPAKPTLTGSFQLPFETHGYMDDRDAETLKQIVYQLGNTAGSVVAIDVPQAQVVDVQPGDSNGMRYQTVSWVAQTDGQTSGTGDVSLTPFRIAFL